MQAIFLGYSQPILVGTRWDGMKGCEVYIKSRSEKGLSWNIKLKKTKGLTKNPYSLIRKVLNIELKKPKVPIHCSYLVA